MIIYLPGTISDVKNVDAGSCIIFDAKSGMHVGVVVYFNNELYILDLDARNERGEEKFILHKGVHLLNNPSIKLEKSRINPAIISFGQGLFNNGRASRILYLAERGAIVCAEFDGNSYNINLLDGSVYNGNLGSLLHAKQWWIEICDGVGNFQQLREFSA